MATVSLDEETVKKVIRQVEFYFSDSNLPRDNFLKKTITESEDGMVSLALICSFSRMRNHLNLGDVKAEDVSEDTVKAVAETLRKSNFLKVSEDGTKVGRATEILKPEEVIEQLDNRTIAASPLEYDLKLEDVESFFGQFAKVNSVRLPRHVADKKLFCGTALIEFSSEEDAEKVLKQSLVYAGAELELKPKKDFDIERAKHAEEVGNTCSEVGANYKNSSNAEASYPKGLIVAFKLKSTSADDSAEQSAGDVNKSDGKSDSTLNATEEAEDKDSEDVKGDEEMPGEDNEEIKDKDSDDVKGDEEMPRKDHEEIKDKDSEDVKGDEEMPGEDNEEIKEKLDEKTSLEIEGKETEEGDYLDSSIEKDKKNKTWQEKPVAVLYKDNKDVILREDLKAVFQKYGTVKFIDFTIGADSGYIRFEEPGSAQKARAAAALAEGGGLVVKNFIATLDPVTGEAEREYWSLLRGNQGRHRENIGNRGRGGRHYRGGKQFNGRRSRNRDNESATRQNKFQKVGAA